MPATPLSSWTLLADGGDSESNALSDALSDLLHSGVMSWIVLGLVAGTIAKILLPGRDPGGVVGTVLIGIAGAFIGGWLSATFLDRPVANNVVDPSLWVASIAGSLVLLIVYRLLFGHSRERR
ncbi:GlsB/YeaQ/YmgE family stress response membrane protein [Streptomyces reniochalinae]|uniref:GlsB/YeaQ/YmgE family stress response membrane protein n=2 Tax=Streptomyces reniochalinae TaxID=2250578 RepID=A0A367EF98_9ACTN|nr:GlsB/YeaQ/YmgE family stress response membrane protein [Streptomyces reniochalinae]